MKKLTIVDKVFGYSYLFYSTFLFTGMFLWLFGKRGKGAGTITSIFVTIILVILYSKTANPPSSGILICGTAIFVLLGGLMLVEPAEEFMLERWGARKRHTRETVKDDFNETTIDEVHGMLIAVSPIYFCVTTFSQFLILHVIALVAFRIFDTAKLWPIKRIEKSKSLGSGMRVMFDDTTAGIMALPFVLLANWLIV